MASRKLTELQKTTASQLVNYLEIQASLYGTRQGISWPKRILDHGAIFISAPDSQQPERGKPHECFYNSFMTARGDTLIYCEGWAVPSFDFSPGFPVLHGWLLNVNGQVLETTWERPGIIYIGIPFRRPWHFAASHQHRTPVVCEQLQHHMGADPIEWRHPVAEYGQKISPSSSCQESKG